MAKLVFNDPNGIERCVEVGQQNPIVMIGRNPDCGVQTNDPSVSRVHAMVTYKDGRLYVQDPPNSRPTNGTKVDGMRLSEGEVLELYASSELVCGKFKIRVVSDNSTNDAIPQMGSHAPTAQPYVQQARETSVSAGPVPLSGRSGGPGAPVPFQGSYNGQPPQNFPKPPGQIPPQQYNGMPPSYNNGAPQGASNFQNAPQPLQPLNMNAPMTSGVAQAVNMYDQRENTRAKYDPRWGNNAGQDDPNGRSSFDLGRSNTEGTSRASFEGTSRVSTFDRNKRPGRGATNYHPGQGHASTTSAPEPRPASPKPQAQPVPATPAPAAKLQPVQLVQNGNMNDLMRELEELRAQKVTFEEEIKSLKTKLEDADREIADYTQRCDCHETVTAGFKEMIDKLKEQLEHQKEQNKETKKDLLEAQEKNEGLEIELSSLKESLESKGMATSNAETTIADLKVQLSQKTRQLSDAQRELDLAQYNIKEERDNVARLEQNLAELNASYVESERHCRDMKKIIEQHEVQYGDLRSNLEDRALEIRQLQDALRKQGSGDTAALLNELNQTKDILARRTSECEAVKREFAELQAKAGRGGDADPALMGHLKEIARNISDGIGQWRGDLQTLENGISDLQRAFVPYVRLDLNSLQGQDRVRIENMLKDYDPKLIFEDIGNALDLSQTCLSEVKGHVQELKTSLENEG